MNSIGKKPWDIEKKVYVGLGDDTIISLMLHGLPVLNSLTFATHTHTRMLCYRNTRDNTNKNKKLAIEDQGLNFLKHSFSLLVSYLWSEWKGRSLHAPFLCTWKWLMLRSSWYSQEALVASLPASRSPPSLSAPVSMGFLPLPQHTVWHMTLPHKHCLKALPSRQPSFHSLPVLPSATPPSAAEFPLLACIAFLEH